MTRFAVALGSNVGERLTILRHAVASIGQIGTVAAVSGLYETEPVGGPEQPSYLNSVVILESRDGPEVVLHKLQEIENEAGRMRTVPWGPRTLDLDLVASDGEAVATEGLQMPHPRASERRFVLAPLTDVWPDADVGRGLTASAALELIQGQEIELLAQVWADPEMWPDET